MRPVAFLLLALLVVPTAVAQVPGTREPALGLFIENPGRAFVPGASELVWVVVTYTPGQTGLPSPSPTQERPENTSTTRIALTAKQQPAWVTEVTFEPAELYIDHPFHNVTVQSYQRRVQMYLKIAPDAPALERGGVVVTASSDANGAIPAMTADSPEEQFRPAIVGKLNVTPLEPLVVLPGGRWTSIVYNVRNEGNSEIVAELNVTVRPENSQVEFPKTLQLARGAAQDVEVRIRTPWTNAEFGSLEFEATPIVNSEPGTPARSEVQVRGESAVPFPAGGVLLALLVVALARRHR